MNAQESGKFVAYKDAVLIMPFIEGRGLPHDFSKYRNTVSGTCAKWGVNYTYLDDLSGFLIPDSRVLRPTTRITEILDLKLEKSTSLTQTSDWREFFGKSGYWTFTSYISDNYIRWFLERPDNIRHGVTGASWKVGRRTFATITFDTLFGIKGYRDGVFFASNTGAIGQTIADTTGIDARLWVSGFARAQVYFAGIFVKSFTDSEVKSAYYYATKKPKPTCVTRRGVYQAVKNTGIEVDGNLVRCTEAMV